MYDYEHRDRFYTDGTYKQYAIIIAPEEEGDEPISLTNEDLDEESFEFYDSIMDKESLSFANCISAYIQFTTYYTDPLIGRLISVYEVIENDTENPIPIGLFTVQSDNVSSDGKTREIIAYDQMFNVINTNVIEWYNTLSFPIAQKDLRDNFFALFGIEQDASVLINDDISFPKQINDEDYLTGDVVVKAICDMNGVFAHIDKNGILKWISLDTGSPYQTGLFPSSTTYPGEETYPGYGYTGDLFQIPKSYHKDSTMVWANYETLRPDGIQIRNEYSEIAYQTNPAAENPYTIIGNFLCYGLSSGQYSAIAARLLAKLRLITYVPFRQTKMGDPCLEVGDRVVVYVKDAHELLSYVFSKHVKGIQVPFEDIETLGTLYLAQYEVGRRSPGKSVTNKIKNLDNRIGNLESSGTGRIQIVSVASLPQYPELDVLYLIQGEVEVN